MAAKFYMMYKTEDMVVANLPWHVAEYGTKKRCIARAEELFKMDDKVLTVMVKRTENNVSMKSDETVYSLSRRNAPTMGADQKAATEMMQAALVAIWNDASENCDGDGETFLDTGIGAVCRECSVTEYQAHIIIDCLCKAGMVVGFSYGTTYAAESEALCITSDGIKYMEEQGLI